MKKYFIAILITLILMLVSITAIGVKLYTADYSPNIKVTVENKPTVETTSATSHRQSTSQTESKTALFTNVSTDIQNTPSNYSSTVYITPYGLKYHYRKTCAGKNATEIELDSAAKTFDSCAKCVH